MPVNRKPRKLDQYHQEISLNHMPGGWCFDCHNPDNRDKLRLANGGTVPFEESYRLCGQCHGTVLRDWEVGLHGKRTGMWNGEKQYLLCAHCHWPHDPVFKPLAPMPAPVRPSAIKPMKQETQKSSNGERNEHGQTKFLKGRRPWSCQRRTPAREGGCVVLGGFLQKHFRR
jgi:hypothetical protein